jgi:hypothetical protein
MARGGDFLVACLDNSASFVQLSGLWSISKRENSSMVISKRGSSVPSYLPAILSLLIYTTISWLFVRNSPAFLKNAAGSRNIFISNINN